MALQKKTPVVTIMGHIDHGKTSLLDFIRKSRLTAKESGGITQSIGAYQIKVGEEKITFIDTPGHEAFSKMRSRGAKVADLAVLVISATDGVMPQTKECLGILKECQTPFVVAINKIDLPEASVDKVRGQLAENEVFVEGYGGKVVAVPVSAKTGQGVNQLLEMILLSAEMESLQADPEGDLQAFVIESRSDKLCGTMASLIIKNGTLKKGDIIQAGDVFAKVKMLKDEWGKPREVALPGDPVQVLGFWSLPAVGSLVRRTVIIPERGSKAVAKKVLGKKEEEEEKKLKIILKTDVLGSLEAISSCLPKEVFVIVKAVGDITESDVFLAKTFAAEIYGFNLSPTGSVQKLAETEEVIIKTYSVIYDLLKEIQERLKGKTVAEEKRKILGKAEVVAIFEIKGEKIAGCRVIEGKINKSFSIFLQRGEKVLGETKIVSLKQQKQDINEATAGMEFGATFSTKLDFQPQDVIFSYSLEEN